MQRCFLRLPRRTQEFPKLGKVRFPRLSGFGFSKHLEGNAAVAFLEGTVERRAQRGLRPGLMWPMTLHRVTSGSAVPAHGYQAQL